MSFVPAMMPLEIETPRLVARPPGADDVPALLALYGDPVVAARLYPDGSPRTAAQVSAGLEADMAHWRAHGFGRFMWQERDTGEVVARCGPKHALCGGRPEIDLHWAVRGDRHRRGFAAEAAEAVVRACFVGLGVESVTALTHVDSVPSERLTSLLGVRAERVVEYGDAPHRLHRCARA